MPNKMKDSNTVPLPRRKKIYSKSEKAFDIVNIIIMIIVVVVTLAPIINLIATAFSHKDSTNTLFWPEVFDMFSVKTVLGDAEFFNALLTTIIVVVLGTTISVLCMTMLGYALSKKKLPFRKPLMVFFLITMLFSGGMVPNYIIMSTLKLTDTIFALIFPSVVMVFHMILAKNFFEGLPESLEESARIDGAGNFRIFFNIILPISLPMIITIALFTAVVYWNNYTNALLYLSSSSKDIYPLSFYIVQMEAMFADPNASQTMGEKFFYKDNVKAAIVFLSMLPIACTYPFFLKYFTKGVTVGSVKG